MTEKGTAIAPRSLDMSAIHKVLMQGNLASLSEAQKLSYFEAVCESVGLNPLTAPFEFLRFQGKEVMYAKRNCTDQLRQIHHISVIIVSREVVDDCYVVVARATHPTGRQDEAIGAVPIAGLKGEARSNALMKAETKAKRRVTLSICGLSFLDDSELESIGEYKRVPVPDRRRPAPQEAQRPSLKEMALEHAKQKTPLEIQLEASIVSTTHEAPPEIPPDLFDSVEPPEDVFVPSLDRMVPELDACKNAHDLDVWYARYAPLRPKLDKEVREAMGKAYAHKRKEFGMKVNPRATVTTFKHTDAGFVEVGSREE